ncbi:MAG TPA: hypothetical protein VIW73_06090 [Candidatus Cybelea sp.]
MWSFALRIGIVSAFGVLTGCSGLARQRVVPVAPNNPTVEHSWMAPVASAGDLLYASDGASNTVYVFSYRRAELLGELTGLPGDALTVCSDREGDVFVGVYASGNNKIVEYAHGGTQPIETLSAPGEPTGCSVDAGTGNLAAALYTYTSAPGSVAVYQEAQGTPTVYTDPNIPYVSDCAYDDKGDLFVSGANDQGFALGELPAGGTTMQDILVKGKIGGQFFQPIGWDGRYLAIGDFIGSSQQYVLYRVKVVGKVGRIVGTSSYALAHGNFSGDSRFWIQGSTALFPTENFNRRGSRASQIGYWAYPSGGNREMETKEIGSPYVAGVTVSVGNQR